MGVLRPVLFALAAIATLAAQSFDVASVKPYHDSGVGPRDTHLTYGPQGIDFRNNLAMMIGEAYHFPVGRILGPGSRTREGLWEALQQSYDVIAKSDHPVSRDDLRLMLRTLLAERFQLTVHRESKTAPVYRLLVGKDGPKLEEADPPGDLSMSREGAAFVYRNAEISRLAGYLSSYLDRTVVDDTGLKGFYNFSVRPPEDLQRNPPAKTASGSPEAPNLRIFAEALKELGLQLVPATAPVEYLVVDRVAPPSAN